MLELNRYICTRSTVFVDVDDGVVAGVVDVHVVGDKLRDLT